MMAGNNPACWTAIRRVVRGGASLRAVAPDAGVSSTTVASWLSRNGYRCVTGAGSRTARWISAGAGPDPLDAGCPVGTVVPAPSIDAPVTPPVAPCLPGCADPRADAVALVAACAALVRRAARDLRASHTRIADLEHALARARTGAQDHDAA